MSETHHGRHGKGHPAMETMPGGLAVSVGGYTLEAAPTMFEAGREETFGIRILDLAGRVVRDLDEQHGVRMHLVVVRRDLTRYQHLHPSLGVEGTWSVPLTLPEPGVYRAFVDFAVRGESLTLGVDLSVPGYYEPRSLPAPTDVARIGDYEVALDAGVETAGSEAVLVFHITRRGKEVVSIEPYLGALGHLVVLREGDLAYLHVHPLDTSGTADGASGGRISLHAWFPSVGRYRLFLQFAHEGLVHTAAFTIEVPS